MARKKEINKDVEELKAKLQEGKAIIGTERVLKAVKEESLEKVFLAKNCPAKIRDDISYYADLAKISIVELDLDNEELGVICKRNHFISVLGIVN